MAVKRSKVSQIYLIIANALLICFSLGSTIYLIIKDGDGLSGVEGVNKILLIVAIIISCFSIASIILSILGITWFLQIYEIVCLVAFTFLIIIVISLGMMQVSSTDCNNPSNYLELKMLEMSKMADLMHCQSVCPCLHFPLMEMCPSWESSSFEPLMKELEERFQCAGWCEKKDRHVFSNTDSPILGPCHDSWSQWIKSQWSVVIGICIAFIALVLNAIVANNWRILTIWENKEWT